MWNARGTGVIGKGVIMNQRRYTHAPMQRITQPLVREDGVLRPATWDEALDRAAAGFAAARDTHGPNSVGVFSCSKSTNEMNFVAQKFARVAIGTNNIDSCNRT
jgi:predicted molibdopterin-dependent oxidoreductase YjgC